MEKEAVHITTHLPAFMMYSVVLDHKVTPAEVKRFITTVYDKTTETQVLNVSLWDREMRSIVMDKQLNLQGDKECVADDEYFNFDRMDYMEHHKGNPRLTKITIQARIEFDPDTQSL